MKLTNAALSLMLVAKSSASIAPPDDEFDEVAAAFHLSSELVRDSYLRGFDQDAIVSTDESALPRNRNNRQRRNEWLAIHNAKREEFLGTDFTPMEWNEALKAEAEAAALENVAICKETVPKSPYGWNVAGKQGKSDFRNVEDVMMIWENKLDGGFPKNSEFLQVLWSGTRYVGCADAVSPPGSEKTCTFSVCFYAKPGVCGMEKRFKGDWEKAVKEGPSCGDVCPPDMEECN